MPRTRQAAYGAVAVVFDFLRPLRPRLELAGCLFTHGLPHHDPTDPMEYYLGGRPETAEGLARSFAASGDSMSAWDEDYIDEEEEGFFEFNDKGWGEFHFGYVHGQMDCRLTTRDGEPTVEWSWDSNAEMDAAQGRGWAVVRGDELYGMIFFHGGDDSEFVAKRKSCRSG